MLYAIYSTEKIKWLAKIDVALKLSSTLCSPLHISTSQKDYYGLRVSKQEYTSKISHDGRYLFTKKLYSKAFTTFAKRISHSNQQKCTWLRNPAGFQWRSLNSLHLVFWHNLGWQKCFSSGEIGWFLYNNKNWDISHGQWQFFNNNISVRRKWWLSQVTHVQCWNTNYFGKLPLKRFQNIM